MRAHNSLLNIGVILFSIGLAKLLRGDGPWSNAIDLSIKLAIALITFRIFIGAVIGVPVPGKVLFHLPTLPLPSWMAGVRIGGAVTWERLSSTALEGLTLAAIIILFGAATSLTNPRALLKSFPSKFYEIGMVLVIASTITPQLLENVKRIKVAQQIRGINSNRFLRWRQSAMPLLEDSLARALDLAAALDSRGYGISRKRSKYRPVNFALNDALIVASSLLFLVLVR